MRNNTRPRVVVVGAGAIGGLFAAKLATANVNTTLMARTPEAAAWLNKQGVTIVDESVLQWVHVPTACLEDEDITADVVIVAVKTFDLETVFSRLTRLARRASQIVCVQSSLRIAAHVPAEHHRKTLAAALMIGASGSAGGLIFVSPHGRVHVGGLVEATTAHQVSLATRVLSAIADVKISNPVLPELFVKVAFNVACFPFSVAGRCSFGVAFLENAQAVQFAAQALQDCARLAEASGFHSRLSFGPIRANEIATSPPKSRAAIEWLARQYASVIPSSVFDHLRRKQSELPGYFDDIFHYAAQTNTAVPALVALRSRFDEMLARQIPLGPSALSWLSRGCSAHR